MFLPYQKTNLEQNSLIVEQLGLVWSCVVLKLVPQGNDQALASLTQRLSGCKGLICWLGRCGERRGTLYPFLCPNGPSFASQYLRVLTLPHFVPWSYSWRLLPSSVSVALWVLLCT